MDILFSESKLAKLCNDDARLVRVHGPRRAALIRARLDALRIATSLEMLRHLPGRLHELKGDRKGQLSLDLDHPYRLILRPLGEPPSVRDDGGLNWAAVTGVVVLGVEDTHG